PRGPKSRIPFGTRAPSFAKRFESLRKSTISCISSRASSSPATSSQETDDSEVALADFGVSRGITWRVRQSRWVVSAEPGWGRAIRGPARRGPPPSGRGRCGGAGAPPTEDPPREARATAKEHGIRPAQDDDLRIC